jgi:cytoskeletal protein CcmA (bactofilin family)
METLAGALGTRPPSRIGEDLTITGNVTSKGALHLDGQVQGDVHCIALVLGEKAQLQGNVVAEDVIVSGRLIGSVRALRVTLQGKSHVEGNLIHKSLSVEQDAHFEGDSHPSEDPLAPEVAVVAPQPNHNGCHGSIKQREHTNGFIRSLPESQLAQEG